MEKREMIGSFVPLVLSLLFFLPSCVRKVPLPPLPPEYKKEFQEYAYRLSVAMDRGELKGVKEVVERWISTHPPSVEEGDLYGSLLTSSSLPPPPHILYLGVLFRERFPDHPHRKWGNWIYAWSLFLEKKDSLLLSFLEQEEDLPSSGVQDLKLRLALRWIEEGKKREGILLAIKVGDLKKPYFIDFLTREILSLPDSSFLLGTPLEKIHQFREAVRRGEYREVSSLSTNLLHSFPYSPSFSQFLERFQEIPPSSTPGIAFLYQPDPRVAPLMDRLIELFVTCPRKEGETLTFQYARFSPFFYRYPFYTSSGGLLLFGFYPPSFLPSLSSTAFFSGGYLLSLNPVLPDEYSSLGSLGSIGLLSSQQGSSMVEVLKERGIQSVALFLSRDEYGFSFLKTFYPLWISSSGWFTDILFFSPDQVDFTEEMDELTGRSVTAPREVWKKNPPPPSISFDGIVLVGPPKTVARIPSQLLYHDVVSVPVFADISLQHPQVFRWGGTPLEGVGFLSYIPSSPIGCLLSPEVPFPIPVDLVLYESLAFLSSSFTTLPPWEWKIEGVRSSLSFNPNRTLNRPFSLSLWTRKGVLPYPEGKVLLFGEPPGSPP
jgi:hypothetical protein